MKNSVTGSIRFAMLTSVATFALLPSVAAAQSQDENEVDDSEIVVTGTLLRGAPPVGSNAITVGAEKIQSTGATTVNELLATVPQVTNLFNNVPTARLGVASNQIQVVRPNLRNLAGETSSSASTLVLFDGQRVVQSNVTGQVDIGTMPTALVQRIDVVTAGASAA